VNEIIIGIGIGIGFGVIAVFFLGYFTGKIDQTISDMLKRLGIKGQANERKDKSEVER